MSASPGEELTSSSRTENLHIMSCVEIQYSITRCIRYCCPSSVAPILPRVEGGDGESHTGDGVDESRPACCALLSCQSALIAPESLRHLTRAGRLCPGVPPGQTAAVPAK